MSAKTIVVTGASGGIGLAAARGLARRGHDVVVVGRSPERTAAAAAELGARHYTADFADLTDVRRLAADLLDDLPRIDVLANNAGGIFGDPEPTVDGNELTMQVNHLAPFLLTNLLMPRLLADGGGAAIQTSSVAAKLFGRLDPADIATGRRRRPERAYGDAKLANVVFTRGLEERFGARGLFTAAFHPGVIASNFASGSRSPMRLLYGSALGRGTMGSTEDGADTLVWLADGRDRASQPSGMFWDKRVLATTSRRATDERLVADLWRVSADRVGLPRGSD